MGRWLDVTSCQRPQAAIDGQERERDVTKNRKRKEGRKEGRHIREQNTYVDCVRESPRTLTASPNPLSFGSEREWHVTSSFTNP
jgi:hypothetical protein